MPGETVAKCELEPGTTNSAYPASKLQTPKSVHFYKTQSKSWEKPIEDKWYLTVSNVATEETEIQRAHHHGQRCKANWKPKVVFIFYRIMKE